MDQPKALFTTACSQDGLYDYIGSNISISSPFRATLPRLISYGLRFLKQNIPQIQILEYPSWNGYIRELEERWDVLGFSFRTCEIFQSYSPS